MEIEDGKWHIEKKFPLGLLFIIAMQTITLVYVGTTWKTDIDHRLGNLEKESISTQANSTRLTILEQQYIYIPTTLNRIDEKLDKAKENLEKKETN